MIPLLISKSDSRARGMKLFLVLKGGEWILTNI